jgi:acetolactate decarboxylase
MPILNCEISQSLLDALAARGNQTGETINHIVIKTLAEALQIEHATLFQISIAGALVEGVTQGAITVGELACHGDFGLGTFADFNGEMVVVDGTTYQVAREGVKVARDEAPVPFAVVTHFMPEKSIDFGAITSFDDLAGHLDALRNTGNEFFAVRIEGAFDHVKTRAVCKSDGSASLVDAASRQAEFEFRDAEGVLVGFWTPEYAKSVNVAGWHLHFLTADRRGGGHLLDCQASRLRAQVQHLSDFHMAIPETAAFLKADLTRDTSQELAKAEKNHG